MSIFSDDDLTTDAMPSAPRADPENDTAEDHVHIPQSKTDRKPTTPPKTKQIPHTAFASVINITNSNMVHVGNVVINPAPAAKASQECVLTREVQALFDNRERVNRDDLVFVSQHIDKWRDVGKSLGYSNGELSEFEYDYKEDRLNEVKFKMLYAWMCRETKDATVGTLARVFWQCKEYEAVQLWSTHGSKM